MKISKIEYENFRNFKEPGEIYCSTDGKVTIIYGLNGDGKTTLHQMFQWLFYGRVKFNKTTSSDILYNLKTAEEKQYGEEFGVWASVDFRHNGIDYHLRRERRYRKQLTDAKHISEEVELLRKDEHNNWGRVDSAELVIEEILPIGLSEYFFFDGETMVAELKDRGKTASRQLRNTLYSILDLDIYQNAIDHIGTTTNSGTAIGSLFLKKDVVDQGQSAQSKERFKRAQREAALLDEQINNDLKSVEELKEYINITNQKIGQYHALKDYAAERTLLKKENKNAQKQILEHEKAFGDQFIKVFPKLLAWKVLSEPEYIIDIDAEKGKLIPGLNVDLIRSLLERDRCVCGRPLCQEQYDHLNDFLKMLPPVSFVESYVRELGIREEYAQEEDYEEALDQYVRGVVQITDQVDERLKNIRELDEEKKAQGKTAEKLVEDLQAAEEKLNYLSDEVGVKQTEYGKKDRDLKALKNLIQKQAENNKHNEGIDQRINLLEEVKECLLVELNAKSVDYSERLRFEIQKMIDQMMTTTRTVDMGADFHIKVVDDHGDESKSEGQFAVVSFAYIGGIFNLLKETDALKNKEYPLILDGPFSKLDEIQKQNVIDLLPQFAPQVIIFSKDSLEDNFDKETLGNTYTIKSNEEKNIAEVKEGYLW